MIKNNETLDYFSVLVVGDNPDDQISVFDSLIDLEDPYILYHYSDISKIRKSKIKFYEELLKNYDNPNTIDVLNKEILKLKSFTNEEYYNYLGELNSYDENKNIITFENPNGKWTTCERGGKIFSNYLKNINNNGVISDINSNINWSLIHRNEQEVNKHNRTWLLCVDGVNPESDFDYKIIKNMSRITNYFNSFKCKEEYINYSTSFWTYAIIINGKWFDMEEEKDIDWIINFYDTNIKNLPKKTLLTIYECTK